jgi:CubicO group peptidase (beta-lactamase class C family)
VVVLPLRPLHAQFGLLHLLPVNTFTTLLSHFYSRVHYTSFPLTEPILLKMSFGRPRSSKSSLALSFDLNADQCINELKRLVLSSGTPQVSIHVDVDGKIQKRTLCGPQLQTPSVTLPPRDPAQPGVFAASQAPPDLGVANISNTSLETNDHEVGANTIYAIASLTKILINVAYHRLISQGRYKNMGLSWEKSACDLLAEVRRAKGKTAIRRFARDPTILELLLHRNGFAPMNRVLLGPDGTFLVSEEEFLEIAPLVTEDYFRGEKQGWSVYSNANHIFAGIILEELTGKKLPEIMQEVVFNPLDMTRTVMDKSSLDTLEAAGAIIAEGHRVSGDMSQSVPLRRKYLADTVEVASLGARSCTGDLAKLIREFLMALDNLSDKFQELEALYFFGPKTDSHDGGRVALGGLFCPLDSVLPGNESLNRVLVPLDKFSPYILGKRPSGTHCQLYYKAGSIDGFTSSMYISLKHRAFVIVLANSTGPMDVTDHIARYILQEVLSLSPRAEVVSRAIEAGHRASQRLQDFEREDKDLSPWSDSIEGFVGTYKHVKYGQELEIAMEGSIILRGRGKQSSPMEARASGNTLRIFPGPEGFGIERWSVWSIRDFKREERNGEIFLVGSGGKDRYQRTTVP